MKEVELAEVGKKWLQECYPQSIIWEYDVGTHFKLYRMDADFMELTYLGVPYRIPHKVDGKPTIRKVDAHATLFRLCFLI